MKHIYYYIFICCILCTLSVKGQVNDSLNYPISDDSGHDLALPNPVSYEAFYDIETGNYLVYKKIGDVIVGDPIEMTTEEYNEFVINEKIKDYYKEKSRNPDTINREKNGDQTNPFLPAIKVKSKLFEKIFGGDKIELIPKGYASVDLGILSQKIDNPQILPQNRQNFTIDLQQRIRISMLGKVGKNLNMEVNYDTQSGFAFENRLNLAWEGDEDNIIKKIEFGNVSLPLSTSLITGAQSLFGVKGQFQFGKTKVTTVFSEQRSEARNIVVQGDGLVNTFKIGINDYQDNQHYFISQFFRGKYDTGLTNYPTIQSNIQITRMEVWKIDQGNTQLQEQRSIIALRDLAESVDGTQSPDNNVNTVYDQVSILPGIRDNLTAYSAINNMSLPAINNGALVFENYDDGENFSYNQKARKLNSSEFSYHPQLGYISLNQRLTDDQLLAVAFEYTINGSSQTYKVGEFTNESSDVLLLKLLKPNGSFSTESPLWDLMMKNIYGLNGSQINKENFFLNVTFRSEDGGSINYLPQENLNKPLFIKLFNWDRLNLNGDATDGGNGDGVFDFVPRITIDPVNGRVIFTKVEPFGEYLESIGADPEYIFNELYDNLKIDASQETLATRYNLEGRFQGQIGSGIPLGAFNVPRGSVTVTANGQSLLEGVDYIVDYQLGRVEIINQAIKDSGVPINISLENNSTFNLQRKRFAGINVEHVVNEKLQLGATAINYQERPLTQKAQYGAEPVNNTIVGMNLRYNSEAEFLTRFTDRLPLIETNAPSNISFQAEAAYLIPGQNNAIQNQSYIDDFEETASRITLKDPNLWQLSSSDGIQSATNLDAGFNRGLISWYNIDPRFYGVGGDEPDGVNDNSVSLNMTRRIRVDEIYSNRDFVAGEALYMNTFDLTFYPEIKGPYNNDPSTYITNDLLEREERWGGIMRSLSVTNFRLANIENIEFWVMDPYADVDNPTETFFGNNPELVIQVGNVSEDVLKDGQMLFENGLPTENNISPTQNSIWGAFPTEFPVLYTFDSEGQDRRVQDAGFDGIVSSSISNTLSTPTEQSIYTSNLGITNPVTQTEDPALDDFVFYYSDQWQSEGNVRERYKYFRNPEGNSPSGSLEASSATPDVEDVNGDYNLDLTEKYNEYRVPLNLSDLALGQNNIVDVKEVDVTLQNGQTTTTKWYLFRIPVEQFDNADGDLAFLNNARFMRMYMKGFNQTSTLRFASFDLVRTDWRRYSKNVFPQNTTDFGVGEGDEDIVVSNLEVGSVDFESNANGTPPYVLPPGIVREEIGGQTGVQSQNEASMYMKITDLGRTDARGVFKNMNLDIRRYKKLSAFTHIQNLNDVMDNGLDQEGRFFIRMGSDLSDNYYEYEIQLQYTPQNATSVADIWPDANILDVSLNWFVDAKIERDKFLDIDPTFEVFNRYGNYDTGDPRKRIYVKGRPTLGNITTIMIGYRAAGGTEYPLNRILWVNELRLSGIDNEGGYAANASLNFNLGDFMDISATGSYSSIGFGPIDLGPSQRSQEEVIQYNVNTAVQVDKLLPEKWGLKIPFQYSTGERFVKPKYNPIDNDVELKDAPNKEKLEDKVITYEQTKTLSLTNMRKERKGSKKPRFYDVENLSFSALYSDTYFRDIYTAYNINQNLRASIDYNFTTRGKYIEPFKKAAFLHDTVALAPYLDWIKEFNFNPIPSRFSFRTEIIRNYNEFQFRDINSLLYDDVQNSFNPVFSNKFIFGWQYALSFNLTKSLKIDVNSATRTLADNIGNGVPNQSLIFKDIIHVGRPINYNQTLQVSYKVPLQYFPYLDFLNTDVAYAANYDWLARSTALVSETGDDLGNYAQNTNTITVNSGINFETLLKNFTGYTKFDSIRVGRQRELDSLNRAFKANSELKKPKKFKKYKFKHKYKLKNYPWMVAAAFRRGQLSYSHNNGTNLPGILSEPGFFGIGAGPGGFNSPTFGFLIGSQSDLRSRAYEQYWVSRSDQLLDPYIQTSTEQLTANFGLEPIKDLRIDFNFVRNHQRSKTQAGYNTENLGTNFIGYRDAFVNELASFNSSIISFSSSFSDQNEVYNSLLQNSQVISRRVAIKNNRPLIDLDNDGYIDGYGLTNAEVLIPSFYSSINGQTASKVSLGYKKGFPLPNWNITYTGLTRIPLLGHTFSTIELSHGYKSSYLVNGVQTNLNFYNDENGLDLEDNFYNYYTYNSVVIDETFSPLIGVNLTLRNSMQFSIQYNRNRSHVLSLSNFSLQEDFNKQIQVGFGYTLKDVVLNLRYQGRKKKVKSDLVMRADVRITDNKTTIRDLLDDEFQITGGQNLLSIQFSADYNFSKSLNLRLFFDHQMSEYKISTAYPLTTTRAGISLTFQFGN